MGKGGEIASPIPLRKAVKSLTEMEEKTGDGGDAVRRRLLAELIVLVEMSLPVIEELLKVAIDLERLRFLRRKGFRVRVF